MISGRRHLKSGCLFYLHRFRHKRNKQAVKNVTEPPRKVQDVKGGKVAYYGEYGGNNYLCPVIYDKGQQIDFLNTYGKKMIEEMERVKETEIRVEDKEIAKGAVNYLEKTEADFGIAVDKIFNLIAMMFKSPDFSYEHEWRLVRVLSTSHIDMIKDHFFVRETDGMMMPYMKVEVPESADLIKEIITAPLQLSDTLDLGLDFWLHSLSQPEIKVKKSQVKLRKF